MIALDLFFHCLSNCFIALSYVISGGYGSSYNSRSGGSYRGRGRGRDGGGLDPRSRLDYDGDEQMGDADEGPRKR